MGVNIVVENPDKLEDIRKRESDITTERVKKILATGVKVLFTTRGVDDMYGKMFSEAGAMVVTRIHKDDARRIAKATGATFLSTLANLEGDESFEAGFLGSAAIVEQKRLSDDEYIIIRNTPSQAAVSVVLRGPNDYFLDEMERSLHDALSSVKRVLESGAVVSGGGAVGASSRCVPRILCHHTPVSRAAGLCRVRCCPSFYPQAIGYQCCQGLD